MNRRKRTSRHARFSPRRARRTVAPPIGALERLEERTLLSGNVLANVTKAGDLTVVGQAKGNEVLIQSTSGGALQVSSLDGTTTINGGSGPFTATGFTRDVDVTMAFGSAVVDVGGAGTLTNLPHNLLVQILADNSTVAVANATIAGNVHLTGMTGSGTFTVGSTSTESAVTIGGTLFIVGGNGDNNTIAVFDADITGNLSITSTGAHDQIEVGFDAGLGLIGVEEPAHVIVGGNINITTSDSDSSFLLDGGFSWWSGDRWSDNDWAFTGGWCKGVGPSIVSASTDVSLADVSVTGNVNIETGNGADQILLGAAPAPAGNPLPLVFGPVTIGGHLNLTAGNGGDTVLLDEVSVTGDARVTTGSGDDHIAVLGNSGSFAGKFILNSGAGADKIAIINGATFQNSASINAGGGNDVIWIAQSLFLGTADIDGGAGTDTFLQSQSLFPNSFTPGNPALSSIEVNMPDVSPTDAIVTTNFGWLNTLLGV